MAVSTARGMIERVGFLCYLVLVVASAGLIGLGAISAVHDRDPRPALCGLAGALIVAVVRELGNRCWHFQEWGDSLEPTECTTLGGLGPAHRAHAQELERLLENLADLDRAEPRDVWKVQELRRRAHALLTRDPALRDLYSESLNQHLGIDPKQD